MDVICHARTNLSRRDAHEGNPVQFMRDAPSYDFGQIKILISPREPSTRTRYGAELNVRRYRVPPNFGIGA